MKKKIVIGICGVLAVAAVCFAVPLFARENAAIPVPQLPQTGSEQNISCTVDSTVDFPAENRVPVYTLDIDEPESIQKQVESTLGVESLADFAVSDVSNFYLLEEKDVSVDIDPANGFWSATKNDAALEGMDGPVIPEDLPSDEEAVKIARDYIESNHLFDGDLGEPRLGYSYTGEGESARKMDVSVSFSPRIDGLNVYGLYRIMVVLGDHGEVRDVYKQASPVKSSGTAALKTKEQVVREISESSESVSFYSSGAADSAVMDHCELCYYVDGKTVDGMNYAYPVYRLTGSGSGDPGQDSEVIVLVDALQR